MAITFGDFIKDRRTESRISLRAMSDAMGIDPSNYSKIERGRLQPPAPDKLSEYRRLLAIVSGSEEDKEMERLASIGRGQIPPALLSDEQVMAKLPVFFRTLEGGPVDEALLEELYNALKRE